MKTSGQSCAGSKKQDLTSICFPYPMLSGLPEMKIEAQGEYVCLVADVEIAHFGFRNEISIASIDAEIPVETIIQPHQYLKGECVGLRIKGEIVRRAADDCPECSACLEVTPADARPQVGPEIALRISHHEIEHQIVQIGVPLNLETVRSGAPNRLQGCITAEDVVVLHLQVAEGGRRDIRAKLDPHDPAIVHVDLERFARDLHFRLVGQDVPSIDAGIKRAFLILRLGSRLEAFPRFDEVIDLAEFSRDDLAVFRPEGDFIGIGLDDSSLDNGPIIKPDTNDIGHFLRKRSGECERIKKNSRQEKNKTDPRKDTAFPLHFLSPF